jgi:hypothetical protein
VSVATTQQPRSIRGVWLPIVTPFLDGAVDFDSYEGLLGHYLQQGVSGIVPLGTRAKAPPSNRTRSRRSSILQWRSSMGASRSTQASEATRLTR